MVTAAINIFIYTAVFFLIGMYKPNWALFFMKKPDRIIVLVISVVLFMVAATLFGEGTWQKKLTETPVSVVSEESVPVVSPAIELEKENK